MNNKGLIYLISILIILSISILGCLYNQTKNNPKKEIPSTPDFSLDSNGKPIIIWHIIEQKEYSPYVSILTNEKIETKKITISNKNLKGETFCIDTDNIIHLFCIEEESIYDGIISRIYYYKYNLNSNLIIYEKIIIDNNRRNGLPQACSDQQNNLYLTWESTKNEGSDDWNIFFMKIDKDGNIGEIKTIINTEENERLPYLIQHNDKLYLTYEKNNEIYYSILNKEGEIISPSQKISDNEIIKDFPIISINGSLLSLSQNSFVDSSNNIHIYSQEFEAPEMMKKNLMYNKLDSSGNKPIENKTIYTEFRYDPQLKIDSLDNIHLVWKEDNHIYYTKLDDNGNKLIDRMKIV